MLQERFTKREKEVLLLMADYVGYAHNSDMATKLSIAPSTVKRHVRGVLGKLGVTNRHEAIQEALRRGLIIPASMYVPSRDLRVSNEVSDNKLSGSSISEEIKPILEQSPSESSISEEIKPILEQRPPEVLEWCSLTKRQREIAVKLIDISGARLSSRDLAAELGVTETTMKKHLQRIYRRIGVKNKSSLVVVAQRMVAFEKFLEARN